MCTENSLKTEHYRNNGVPDWAFLKRNLKWAAIVLFSSFFGAEWTAVDISLSKWLLSSKLFQEASHWALLEQNVFRLIQFFHQNIFAQKSWLEMICRKKKREKEKDKPYALESRTRLIKHFETIFT